jgi:16S rRNA (uracil1498-N3)-methyltransferase
MISALVPPGALVAGSELGLPDEEAHHLTVRRASPGAPIRLHDGEGAVALGTLLALGSRAAVRVESVDHHPAPPVVRLVVGAGDRDRFGWLVEKAAELGVTEIVPLESALVRSVSGRVRGVHLDRLRRQAREAIKQSGAPWAPAVTDLRIPEQVCAQVVEGTRWLADPAGGAPTRVGSGALTAVIGPEGGLTEGEQAQFRAVGFAPVRLGPHLLRFETAAIAAAVVARLPFRGGVDE